jgi:ABC-type iron transport system FetAB permease component
MRVVWSGVALPKGGGGGGQASRRFHRYPGAAVPVTVLDRVRGVGLRELPGMACGG